MGRKTAWYHSRLSNLKRSVQKVVGQLSPRKKRRITEEIDEETDKENLDPQLDAQNVKDVSKHPKSDSKQNDDVFTAPPWLTHMGVFPLPGLCLAPPNEAPTSGTFTYTLPSPISPCQTRQTRQPTVEDDVISISSCDSKDSCGQPRDHDTFSIRNCHPEADTISIASSCDEPRSGKLREAPLLAAAMEALKDLNLQLRGESRGKGGGYKNPNFDPFVRFRLDGMRALLNLYVNQHSQTYEKWIPSSMSAAVSLGRGIYCARQLRKLSRAYISDRTVLPLNPYGDWNESLLVDEDLMTDINWHLQELGTHIMAEKLAAFLARDDIMKRHGITRKISVRTARRYLTTLGFRFTPAPKGQFSDGHERADVVAYRDTKYIPRLRELQKRVREFLDGVPKPLSTPAKPVILWFHDESIFYAHDRRRKAWYHKDSPAKPYKKGEGVSWMVADFVSADFGWLRSKDGTRSARRIMRPGKNRDGYFSNDDIIEQVNAAMDLCDEYPEFDHVFIYDNAPSHLKRGDGDLSARKMPKNPSKNFLVEVTARQADGTPEYDPTTGRVRKVRMKMRDTEFNGQTQHLYFPDDHAQYPGMFKAMAILLQERGLDAESRKNAECKGFRCPPPALDCCCRRVLFNQPDFEGAKTVLEIAVEERGFTLLFLPKFHCELNPIEQCWGYAKRLYRLYPESSREDQLEKNALEALESIPLETIRRFATRARRFQHAYFIGLNGRQAAWAARKYRGHRVLPDSIMKDLENANIS